MSDTDFESQRDVKRRQIEFSGHFLNYDNNIDLKLALAIQKSLADTKTQNSPRHGSTTVLPTSLAMEWLQYRASQVFNHWNTVD